MNAHCFTAALRVANKFNETCVVRGSFSDHLWCCKRKAMEVLSEGELRVEHGKTDDMETTTNTTTACRYIVQLNNFDIKMKSARAYVTHDGQLVVEGNPDNVSLCVTCDRNMCGMDDRMLASMVSAKLHDDDEFWKAFNNEVTDHVTDIVEHPLNYNMFGRPKLTLHVSYPLTDSKLTLSSGDDVKRYCMKHGHRMRLINAEVDGIRMKFTSARDIGFTA